MEATSSKQPLNRKEANNVSRHFRRGKTSRPNYISGISYESSLWIRGHGISLETNPRLSCRDQEKNPRKQQLQRLVRP